MQEGNGYQTASTPLPRVEPKKMSAVDLHTSSAEPGQQHDEAAPGAPSRGSILARPLGWVHHILRTSTGTGLLNRLGETLRRARPKPRADEGQRDPR